MKKHDLIKIVGEDKALEFSQRDQFLSFLNQDPLDAWLEDHPTAKGVKTLPIGMVELLLTKIFQRWRVEVLKTGQIMNSIECTIRLHYLDPITGEWDFQDGVGAVPARTSRGASAADMTAIQSDAVMTGLPAAKSYAIKDAADEIGKIFGRDINRKGNLAFVGSYSKSDGEQLLDKIAKAKSENELNTILEALDVNTQKAFVSVIHHRLKELKKNG